MVIKCVNGDAPLNLRKMVFFSQNRRMMILEEHFDVIGERALSVCGPRLWNALPTQLRLEVDFDAFNDILFGILT